MISLAYITRNEAEYIGRSINSARIIAGEIIVVDAFSEDSTVDICKELGAKVYQEPWKHDFSHARNIMRSRCTLPWILSLDADEHLEGEDLSLITKAVDCAEAEDIVAWFLPRKNHYPSHDPDSPYFASPFFPDLQLRLFRNLPNIFYSGAVHEGVLPSIEVGEVGKTGRLAVYIHHHMFRGNQAKFEAEKGAYYKKIESGEFDVQD